MTDRGRVEVSMDGTVVRRLPERSFFGFRRRDPSYELRVTGDGIDIMREREVDWSVTATSE
ncbi:unnamed protein product [Scytosiphon promiscuus]